MTTPEAVWLTIALSLAFGATATAIAYSMGWCAGARWTRELYSATPTPSTEERAE